MAPMTSEPRSDEHGMRPTSAVFDQERAQAAVRELLIAVGEDPDRHGLIDTPARVARAYREIFAGLYVNPDDVLSSTTNSFWSKRSRCTPPASTTWSRSTASPTWVTSRGRTAG